MTQVTEQAQQHWAVTSQQVTAKLQTFYDGLTADADTSGHAHPILVRVIAKGIIFAIDRLANSNSVSQVVPNLDYSHFGEDTTPR